MDAEVSQISSRREEATIDQFHPIITDEHIKAVTETLRSGWINEGPKVKLFEEMFAKFAGTRFAVACTSGSVALLLACRILSLRGNKISVPDYTFAAVPNAVKWAGCIPNLRDVNERGLILPEYSNLEIAVASNGRFPIVGDAIEDRSQALGNQSLGDKLAVYSLASTKHLTTGQGGMITTNESEMHDAARRLRDQGRLDKSDFFESNGLNFKMTDIQASLGLVELSNFTVKTSMIWEIYRTYNDLLGKEYFLERGSRELPWYVDIYVDDPSRLRQHLQSKGIGTRRHYKPLHDQPAFVSYGNNHYPSAYWFFDHGLYLPSSEDLTDEDVKMICGEIQNAKPRPAKSLTDN